MTIVADDSLRGVSGVYQIRNLINGKVYVGSTKNLFGRCREHRYDLKAGRHFSRRLQSSWNKHGADAFVFEVIEFCDPDDRLVREKFWIRERKAVEKYKGYNAKYEPKGRDNFSHSEETKRKIGAAHRGRKMSPESIKQMLNTKTARGLIYNKQPKQRKILGKRFSFTAPDGTIHTGVNVKKFALSQGLCPFGLTCVFNQRKQSYKGWTKTGGKPIGRTPQVEFDLTAPDGTRYVGKNVHRFAREHGLNARNLGCLVRGDVDSSEGWIRTGSGVKPPVRKLEFALISPEGKLYTGTSLKEFAREHGLTYPNLHKVHLGLRNHCKGWRKALQTEGQS